MESQVSKSEEASPFLITIWGRQDTRNLGSLVTYVSGLSFPYSFKEEKGRIRENVRECSGSKKQRGILINSNICSTCFTEWYH